MIMKIINIQKNLLTVLVITFCAIAKVQAEPVIYKMAFVGDTGNSAYLGAKQGLSEANLQGQFLNHQYVLDVITPDQALDADYSSYVAVIAAVDISVYRKLTDLLPDMPVFNVWLADDSLRIECRANALHIVPSNQMKADAIAQWHQLHPDAQVTARTWHPDFVKFAARDLNKRFKKAYNTKMDDPAWAGWAAVKMTSDTIARKNITDPKHLLAYLKTELTFDGQMGIDMNFRKTGQLRQPMLLIENDKIVGEAPVRGVAKPPNVDSLGNVDCGK